MIKLTGYFNRFGSKADGSASLSFTSQELTPEDFANLKKDLNEFGWIQFVPNANTPPPEPEEDADEGDLSQSKRLKKVLYVRWKQLSDKKETDKDFNTYYRMVTEAWIESVKSKLD